VQWQSKPTLNKDWFLFLKDETFTQNINKLKKE
jgi:hypothetical protein